MVVDLWLPDGPLLIEVGGRGGCRRGSGDGRGPAAPRPCASRRSRRHISCHGVKSLVTMSPGCARESGGLVHVLTLVFRHVLVTSHYHVPVTSNCHIPRSPGGRPLPLPAPAGPLQSQHRRAGKVAPPSRARERERGGGAREGEGEGRRERVGGVGRQGGSKGERARRSERERARERVVRARVFSPLSATCTCVLWDPIRREETDRRHSVALAAVKPPRKRLRAAHVTAHVTCASKDPAPAAAGPWRPEGL